MSRISHAPPGYICPFCTVLAGREHELVWSVPEDIVYQDDVAAALIAAGGSKNNPGHVLVIPMTHFEHLYELPEREGAAVFRLSRAIARAMKATSDCTGVSTRQHNEPHVNQDVWHFHMHVFPRFENDQLYAQPHTRNTLADRNIYADRLRSHLVSHPEVFSDSERATV
ncbi:MAG: HIT family protein [Deinococcus sp.]